MPFSLAAIAIPEFGMTEAEPAIPGHIYAQRAEAAYAAAQCDWLIVYGDLEHFANMTFLCGHDPRFEEALLCLGPAGKRILVVGNEGGDQARLSPLPGLQIALAQSFSLPGMDRTRAPKLTDTLRAIGINKGQRIGLVGWKPIARDETEDGMVAFAIPHSIVMALAKVAGGVEAITDQTGILMDPVKGLRARNDVYQIAAFEWGAARASAAVRRIVHGAKPGMREATAMGLMQHEGEPMTCRPMFSASKGLFVGLKSPGPQIIEEGAAVTAAIGYRGGLTARSGLLSHHDDGFLKQYAAPYFAAQALWCEALQIGRPGGEIEAITREALAIAGLQSAFTPGHLGGHDEWLHSVTTPGATGAFQSGALVQCDIIPTPMPAGTTLNCEDPIILADASLRAEIAAHDPALYARLLARQAFLRETIGIDVADEYLPLTNWAHCLPPFWLEPDKVFVRD
jgi:hypothetical protein